jgi:hypothetical protein
MPIFAYFVVAGSVMIALLFFMGAPPEKGTRRAMVISDVQSLPMPWRPDRKQVLSDAVPAPAPDMTSPLVLLLSRRTSRRLKFWRRARQQIKSKWQRGIAARRLPRGLRRHPRRSVSPARSRQSSTDRTALPHRAESSACLALTDFLSLSRTNGEPSVYNRGYAPSREQAMRYFKARYIGPSN